eukprot:SAG31_NODE_445_length_15593_cov_8.514974_3_plen_2691_part_00
MCRQAIITVGISRVSAGLLGCANSGDCKRRVGLDGGLFTLDASNSMDPDATEQLTSQFSYLWTCLPVVNGSEQVNVSCARNAIQFDTAISINNYKIQLDPALFALSIEGVSVNMFKFTVGVTSDLYSMTRQSSKSVTVIVEPGAPPAVQISRIVVVNSDRHLKADPSMPVAFRCSSSINTTSSEIDAVYVWSATGPRMSEDVSMFVSSSNADSVLQLPPHTLTPGGVYSFACTGTRVVRGVPTAHNTHETRLVVNAPPASGTMELFSGHAGNSRVGDEVVEGEIENKLTIVMSNFVDEKTDVPNGFTYRYYYLLGCHDYLTDVNLLHKGGYSPKIINPGTRDNRFKAALPPATQESNHTFTVIAAVADDLGATTLRSQCVRYSTFSLAPSDAARAANDLLSDNGAAGLAKATGDADGLMMAFTSTAAALCATNPNCASYLPAQSGDKRRMQESVTSQNAESRLQILRDIHSIIEGDALATMSSIQQKLEQISIQTSTASELTLQSQTLSQQMLLILLQAMTFTGEPVNSAAQIASWLILDDFAEFFNNTTAASEDSNATWHRLQINTLATLHTPILLSQMLQAYAGGACNASLNHNSDFWGAGIRRVCKSELAPTLNIAAFKGIELTLPTDFSSEMLNAGVSEQANFQTRLVTLSEHNFIPTVVNATVGSPVTYFGVDAAVGEPVQVQTIAAPTLRVIVRLPLLGSIAASNLTGLAPICAQIATNGTLLIEKSQQSVCTIVHTTASSVSCECTSTAANSFQGAVVVVFRPSACAQLSHSSQECIAAPDCGWCTAQSHCMEGSISSAFFPNVCSAASQWIPCPNCVCMEDEYVTVNVSGFGHCSPCEAGRTNAFGDHPMDNVPTECEDISCPPNADGRSIAEGCTCRPGYTGHVLGTRQAPHYFSGECSLAPIDCVGHWTQWSSCTALCGGGNRSRSYVVTVAPAHGGIECSATASEVEVAVCNAHPCEPAQQPQQDSETPDPEPEPFSVVLPSAADCAGEWSTFSACTRTCGGGLHSRLYNVTVPAANGGRQSTCAAADGETSFEPCNEQPCPADCVGSWTGWSLCSTRCGPGNMTRSYRVAVQAAHGGSTATCETADGAVESRSCSSDPCPVNCVGSWSEFGNCTRQCGGGLRTRTYTATTVAAHGGSESTCAAVNGSVSSETCNDHPCSITADLEAIDCAGEWSAFSACTRTCGGGLHSRLYNVTVPAANGGRQSTCAAADGETSFEPCNEQPCPADCVGSWTGWSLCSTRCGPGNMTRSYRVAVQAAHGGSTATCETADGAVESRSCSSDPCPVNCVGRWLAVSNCTRQCGGGTQPYIFIVTTAAAHGGSESTCAATNGHIRLSVCNVQPCAVSSDGQNLNCVADQCGICDADASNDCRQDCTGIWGGIASTDLCGVCGGTDACLDCAGVAHGTGLIDKCGVCNNNSADDCVSDCSGTWGGSEMPDACNICGGDNSTCGQLHVRAFGTSNFQAAISKTALVAVMREIVMSDMHDVTVRVTDYEQRADAEFLLAGITPTAFVDRAEHVLDGLAVVLHVPRTALTLYNITRRHLQSAALSLPASSNASTRLRYGVLSDTDFSEHMLNTNFASNLTAAITSAASSDGRPLNLHPDCLTADEPWFTTTMEYIVVASTVNASHIANLRAIMADPVRIASELNKHEANISAADVTCSSVVEMLDVDCWGVAGGNSTFDACGVCAGDGLACLDCNGDVNGHATVDECGHCDDIRSNDCVADCIGVWGGTSQLDECYVCSGNSTCLDCANEPHGVHRVDNCGICRPNLADHCVQDCAGTWGGALLSDDCGVCGGDGNLCGNSSTIGEGPVVIPVSPQVYTAAELLTARVQISEAYAAAQRTTLSMVAVASSIDFENSILAPTFAEDITHRVEFEGNFKIELANMLGGGSIVSAEHIFVTEITGSAAVYRGRRRLQGLIVAFHFVAPAVVATAAASLVTTLASNADAIEVVVQGRVIHANTTTLAAPTVTVLGTPEDAIRGTALVPVSGDRLSTNVIDTDALVLGLPGYAVVAGAIAIVVVLVIVTVCLACVYRRKLHRAVSKTKRDAQSALESHRIENLDLKRKAQMLAQREAQLAQQAEARHHQHVQNIARQILGRMKMQHVGYCFDTWAELVQEKRRLEVQRRLRAAEEADMQHRLRIEHAARKILGRLRMLQVGYCFDAWTVLLHRKRLEQTAARVLRRFMFQSAARAFSQWSHMVVEKKRRDRLLRKTVAKFRNITVARFFTSWYETTCESRRQRHYQAVASLWNGPKFRPSSPGKTALPIQTDTFRPQSPRARMRPKSPLSLPHSQRKPPSPPKPQSPLQAGARVQQNTERGHNAGESANNGKRTGSESATSTWLRRLPQSPGRRRAKQLQAKTSVQQHWSQISRAIGGVSSKSTADIIDSESSAMHPQCRAEAVSAGTQQDVGVVPELEPASVTGDADGLRLGVLKHDHDSGARSDEGVAPKGSRQVAWEPGMKTARTVAPGRTRQRQSPSRPNSEAAKLAISYSASHKMRSLPSRIPSTATTLGVAVAAADVGLQQAPVIPVRDIDTTSQNSQNARTQTRSSAVNAKGAHSAGSIQRNEQPAPGQSDALSELALHGKASTDLRPNVAAKRLGELPSAWRTEASTAELTAAQKISVHAISSAKHAASLLLRSKEMMQEQPDAAAALAVEAREVAKTVADRLVRERFGTV